MKVIGSYTDQESFAFLMTPVADCNLSVYLQQVKSSDRPTLRSFYGCLTNAIVYLHSKRIHHMDIKPENVLIKNNKVFVADFGAAHDWSRKERSTTWSLMPRTQRYVPPEVARDSHAPRNSSTDMWSLGVVFLEMTTVLRGRELRDFRQYLVNHGTRHEFVHSNAPATYSWFEVLRTSDAGPDYDNEPLTWVKDLTAKNPLNRPKANGLEKQLSESSTAGQFCGFCCSNAKEEHWKTDFEAPSRTAPQAITVLDDDDNSNYYRYRPDGHVSEHHLLPEAKSSIIEAWLNQGESLSRGAADYEFGPSIPDTCDAPYEIEADDDIAELPAASKTLVPNRIPQRLRSFNFFTEQSDLSNLYAKDDDGACSEAAYEVASDSSSSAVSEKTARLGQMSSEPLTAILEELDNGSDSGLPGEAPQIGGPTPKKANAESCENESPHVTVHDDVTNQPTPRPPPVLGDGYESTSAAFPEAGPALPVVAAIEDGYDAMNPATSTFRSSIDNQESLRDKGGQRLSSNPVQRPSPLTFTNLNKLAPVNEEDIKAITKGKKLSKGKKRSTISAPRFSAKTYMQNIWEAESLAATSVMSERTRSKIGGYLTAYQDRTQNFLGHYSKRGSAKAVRQLLEKDCNPGTKVCK